MFAYNLQRQFICIYEEVTQMLMNNEAISNHDADAINSK